MTEEELAQARAEMDLGIKRINQQVRWQHRMRLPNAVLAVAVVYFVLTDTIDGLYLYVVTFAWFMPQYALLMDWPFPEIKRGHDAADRMFDHIMKREGDERDGSV